MNDETLPVDRSMLPPWAKWLAQDADGAWWAYEQEPNQGAISWYENEVGDSLRLRTDSPNSNWRTTLTKVS